MLPLPPVRYAAKPLLRAASRRADAWTLYAFNPQPPLRRTHVARQPEDARR